MRPLRVSALVLSVCILPGCLAGQASVTFNHVTTASAETPANIYPVDVNNDGLTDLVQDTAQSPSSFSVSLNEGDGTFGKPTVYTLPGNSKLPMPIATADFNHDGNVDVAVILAGTAQIAVYLGNGDGTFQSPNISTIALPGGWVFSTGGTAAADFNADGDVDLVAWCSASTSALYVLQGNGEGGFINPLEVLAGPATQPNFLTFVGDFDSDGRADILATTYTVDTNGNVNNTTVLSLYNDGDFTFSKASPYSADSSFFIGTGDLNGDGRTDFFGLGGSSGSQQLGVFYGNTNRTFSSYFLDLFNDYPVGATPDGDNYISQFTMADFNGDGVMDLAATGFNADHSEAYTEFLLAGSSPGQFTLEALGLPQLYKWETSPVAGLYSGSYLLPDLVLNQSPNGGAPPQNTPSYLTSEANQASTGWFGSCTYPHGGEGFNVCSPGTALNSQTLFSANVNSFGKVRKIELWVDGVKVQEQHHTWDQHAYFDWAGSFKAGAHQATFYAADIDDRLQRNDFTFTVSAGGSGGNGGCAAPSSPSVNVCSPGNNSTVSSPVQALATANIGGETLARMEIWVDGVKQYTETTSTTINISLPLTAGQQHKIDFYAASTSGGLWETSVYATVPAAGGGGGAPQYQAPLFNENGLTVINGQVGVDTLGNTSVQLGGATPNTSYTMQFCPAVRLDSYTGIPCFNVATVTTDSNGDAGTTVKFPQAGDWAGDFLLNNSSGTLEYQTFLANGVANQSYLATLLPQTKTNNGEVTIAKTQDPLTSGTVTLGNNQLIFTVNGALPSTYYSPVESETYYVDSSGTYALPGFTTNASGNGSVNVSLSDGANGDLFQVDPENSPDAGFIAGFSTPQ